MNATVDNLYEKYLSLSAEEKMILKSAAKDTNIFNPIKVARLYLDEQATQPVISAFMKQLKERAL